MAFRQTPQHNITKEEKTIKVPYGNDKIITSMQEYIKGINSFELSINALEICNKLSISNEKHLLIAMKSSLNYLEALRGNSLKKEECKLLRAYNIDFSIGKPLYEISESIRKQIADIKYILYAKQRNFDNELASLAGLLAGVCLYVNEKDLINNQSGKKTKNLSNLCKSYVIGESLMF